MTKYGYTQTYTVNWTAGENTKLFVFAGDESETIENGASIAPGTTVMVSVDVAEGYTLGSLSVKDADGEDVELTEIEANVYYSFEMPASNVTITSSAVEPITGDKYVKVTSTEDLEDGQYLIVYEDGSVAFDGGLETLDAVGNTISVNIVKNEIAANETTNAAAFTIDVTNGTIKSASGLYIGQTSDANGMQSSDTEAYENTISFDEKYNADIMSGKAYLRYNSASNQARFRYYKSTSYASQEAIQLYKKVEVAPILLGDANGDEEVTIADVVAIINYLLDPTSVKFNEAAADFDGQNGVTLAIGNIAYISYCHSSCNFLCCSCCARYIRMVRSLRTERLPVADGQHAHRGRMRRKSRTDEVLIADGRDLTHTNSFPFVLQIQFFSLILQRI